MATKATARTHHRRRTTKSANRRTTLPALGRLRRLVGKELSMRIVRWTVAPRTVGPGGVRELLGRGTRRRLPGERGRRRQFVPAALGSRAGYRTVRPRTVR